MTALYALTGDMLALSAALDACEADADTGEVAAPPDLLALLDAIEGEYAHKLDACARVVRSLASERDAIDDEIGRLRARGDALDRNAQRLSDAMRRSLIATGTHAVKGPLFTVSLRKGSTRVEVTDADALPTQFQRVIPERREPDKKAIADALKAGTDVPGASLVTGEPTLSIR